MNPAWWADGLANASKVEDKLLELAAKHDGVAMWATIEQAIRQELAEAVKTLKGKQADRFFQDDARELRSVLNSVTQHLTQVCLFAFALLGGCRWMFWCRVGGVVALRLRRCRCGGGVVARLLFKGEGGDGGGAEALPRRAPSAVYAAPAHHMTTTSDTHGNCGDHANGRP